MAPNAPVFTYAVKNAADTANPARGRISFRGDCKKRIFRLFRNVRIKKMLKDAASDSNRKAGKLSKYVFDFSVLQNRSARYETAATVRQIFTALKTNLTGRGLPDFSDFLPLNIIKEAAQQIADIKRQFITRDILISVISMPRERKQS